MDFRAAKQSRERKALKSLRHSADPARRTPAGARTFVSAALALVLVLSSSSRGETVRVTRWDLRSANPAPAVTNSPAATRPALGAACLEAAAVVKQLQPDVLLLQHARDWQMCGDIAQALRPADYHISICSALNPAIESQRAQPQAAILSRHNAYFSWSAPWRSKTGGGYAFAAIQVGRQRLGFFSLQLEGRDNGCEEQLLEQLNSIKRWEANRVQSFVVGAAGTPAAGGLPGWPRLVREAAFEDACPPVPPNRSPSSFESLLVDAGGLAVWSQTNTVSGLLLVTCDIELDPVKITAARAVRLAELERRLESTRPGAGALAAAPPPAPAPPPPSRSVLWWLMAALLVSLTLFGLLRVLSWRKAAHTSPPALLPLHAEGGRGAPSCETAG